MTIKQGVLLVVGILLFAGIIIATVFICDAATYRTENHEYVEVVETRIQHNRTRAGQPDRAPTHFVTFRFANGLEEEFSVTYQSFRYMQAGVTGMLTYSQTVRQLERYLDPETPSGTQRGRFESFEKTP